MGAQDGGARDEDGERGTDAHDNSRLGGETGDFMGWTDVGASIVGWQMGRRNGRR